jgi:hypothetical protein
MQRFKHQLELAVVEVLECLQGRKAAAGMCSRGGRLLQRRRRRHAAAALPTDRVVLPFG